MRLVRAAPWGVMSTSVARIKDTCDRERGRQVKREGVCVSEGVGVCQRHGG